MKSFLAVRTHSLHLACQSDCRRPEKGESVAFHIHAQTSPAMMSPLLFFFFCLTCFLCIITWFAVVWRVEHLPLYQIKTLSGQTGGRMVNVLAYSQQYCLTIVFPHTKIWSRLNHEPKYKNRFWEPMYPHKHSVREQGYGTLTLSASRVVYFSLQHLQTGKLKESLTPFQKLQNIFLSSDGRVVALIIKTDEYIQ